MKSCFRLGMLGALALLLYAPEAHSQTTYYVRTDGGTATQCTGTADAAYPGSGASQPCAWAHPFWALTSATAWRIKGGDTLLIESGSYMMGFGAPNTTGGAFNGYDSFPWDVHFPTLPAGPDAAHPTRVVGQGWNSGCPVKPQLWGTMRAKGLFFISEGSNNVDIECLELTDHSQCTRNNSYPTANNQCNTNPPYGDWADVGIIIGNGGGTNPPSGVTLNNLNIHGFAADGINGRVHDVNASNLILRANGLAGWDFDFGDKVAMVGMGNLNFTNIVVEYNGCGETYPGGQPIHCFDQNYTGYGDGFGEFDYDGTWTFKNAIFRYNVQDGLDTLYLTAGATINVDQSQFYGNDGNQFKTSAGTVLVTNSLFIGQCTFFNGQSFNDGNQAVSQCRAFGDTIALGAHPGKTNRKFLNNTFTGEGNFMMDDECREGTSCLPGNTDLILENNIFRGYASVTAQGQNVNNIYNPSNLTEHTDHNLWFTTSGGCPFGTSDVCSNPLFVHDANDATLDAHLQAGSPAIDKGVNTGLTHDFAGSVRPQGAGYDIGAFEFSSSGGSKPNPPSNPQLVVK